MACANGVYVNGTDDPFSNGHPGSVEGNGHLPANGHEINGHKSNGHQANGHQSNGNVENGTKKTANKFFRSDSMKGKCGKNKSGKSKAKQRNDPFSASVTTDIGRSGHHSDTTNRRKCSVCEADVTDSNGERTVCKACIMPHGTNSKIAEKQQKSSWFRQFLNRTLPNWVFEPEYMVHGKPKSDPNLVHRHMDSLFSTSSGFTNYRGLLNLALLLLVLSNARLFLENLIKYGILINPFVWLEWFLEEPYNWPCLLLTMSISVFPLFAFWLECAMAKDWLSDRAGAILYGIHLTILLVYPATVVYIQHPNPVFSVFSLTIATVAFVKLVSYGHVNYWCRNNIRHNTPNRHRSKTLSSSGDASDNNAETENNSKKGMAHLIMYPATLKLQDLAYFMLAPTLCYELNFPRSARIRKRFLAKRLVELLFLFSLMAGLIQQWIVPAVNNSLKPLTDMDFFRVMERLLKLSVPNHFIWLIFFYCFFHSWLNVLAELLMFGDREFYRDWWNAENIAAFWQNWNIPVHRWASRHMYKPLLVRGHSKLFASTAVFLVSAFFHEYLVSIPLRMFKIWAFSGMLMQVPLAILSVKYFHGKWGNIIVWLSLILGQPICILAYVHDYYIMSIISRTLNITATVM